mmetsp:Transcript_19190/g.59761  ORF Transcript_19190/g.59761 Transcript_19190/m.59761 type:complete len:285 (+) Transcript_19190:503-1357(+)
MGAHARRADDEERQGRGRNDARGERGRAHLALPVGRQARASAQPRGRTRLTRRRCERADADDDDEQVDREREHEREPALCAHGEQLRGNRAARDRAHRDCGGQRQSADRVRGGREEKDTFRGKECDRLERLVRCVHRVESHVAAHHRVRAPAKAAPQRERERAHSDLERRGRRKESLLGGVGVGSRAGAPRTDKRDGCAQRAREQHVRVLKRAPKRGEEGGDHRAAKRRDRELAVRARLDAVFGKRGNEERELARGEERARAAVEGAAHRRRARLPSCTVHGLA